MKKSLTKILSFYMVLINYSMQQGVIIFSLWCNLNLNIDGTSQKATGLTLPPSSGCYVADQMLETVGEKDNGKSQITWPLFCVPLI